MKHRNPQRNRFSGIRWLAFFLGLSSLVLCHLTALAGQTNPVGSGVVSAAYKSTDAGATWVPISNGLTCYHVGPLAIDRNSPNTIYAGTDRGVFKTTDGGSHWVQATGLITLFNVQGLAVAPVHSSTVYAGGFAFGGLAILKSTDAGLSWKVISDGLTLSTIQSILIDPENPATLYTKNIFQIFKSTDGGNTWHSVLSLPPAGDVLFPTDAKLCSLNPAILYALGTNHLYKTVNGGSNWTDITEQWRSPSPLSYPSSIAVNPTDAALVYVPDDQGRLHTSTDGGQTWTLMPKNPSFAIRGLTIDPAIPSTFYANANQSLMKSTDRGNTWAATGLSSVSMTSPVIDPTNSSILYVGATGDLRPTDAPWISRSIIDGKKLYIGGQFFDDGAVILLDGEAQPTKNDQAHPDQILLGKKAGKKIRKNPGIRIQVRNANGKLSQEVPIWPPIN
jgi:photosystem II stability/assembly factor-like uncharacterized protein